MSARCPHTGLAIPECSCAACCRRQLRRHAPWLLSAAARKGRASRPDSVRDTRLARAQEPGISLGARSRFRAADNRGWR